MTPSVLAFDFLGISVRLPLTGPRLAVVVAASVAALNIGLVGVALLAALVRAL